MKGREIWIIRRSSPSSSKWRAWKSRKRPPPKPRRAQATSFFSVQELGKCCDAWRREERHKPKDPRSRRPAAEGTRAPLAKTPHRLKKAVRKRAEAAGSGPDGEEPSSCGESERSARTETFRRGTSSPEPA